VTKFDHIQIDYDLKFEAPFHCGTGTRIGLIDRTVVRDREGHLYIPGSTIKGVLREHCEQLARLYVDVDENMTKLIASPHDRDMALHGFGSTTTMITRIFGSPTQPGYLFFDDARQPDEDKKQYDSEGRSEDDKGRYKNLQVDIYTQVRIDRPTRTAVQGALYTSEFGTRDISFKGRVIGGLACMAIDPEEDDLFRAEDSPTYSLLLLVAGLRMIERLGGNKSVGKGQCTCNITEIFLNGKRQDEWEKWLGHLGVLSYYSLSQEEKV
jgi:CRISPR/Cas system CMR subunit Cmr4 (Cas7 group RAMP superfamily)